ncbi:MAG TPA: ABC transporter permease [Stellaceae bacterium]|nr:ABC transporter permease [Stellaceae bacterium]
MNRKLQPLIGRRVLHLLPVIVLATFVVFSLLHLVPGDPAVTLAGDYATPARIAEIRQLYGLDRPFLVQYGVWLGHACLGDLGHSLLSSEDVLQLILHRLPHSALIATCALILSASVGIPLGLAAATRVGSRLDACIGGFVSLGVALPSFWLAMILIGTLSLKLHLFPATGAADLTAAPLDALRHAVLPAVALAFSGVAELARQLRSAMIEVLGSQFVRTLRAKGLSPAAILWRHGLRNVSVTLLTILGLLVNRLFAGAVVIEAVFAVPGIGSLVSYSALNKDFPVVQGVVLVMVVIVISVNLLVDVLNAILDPRVAGP